MALDPIQVFYIKLFNLKKANNTTEYGQWKPMGPFNAPSGGGIGRINNVAFHPYIMTPFMRVLPLEDYG